jgi:membrane fusion protein (multidrug efflux system)
MKKLLIIVSLFLLIVTCKSEKKPSISELIASDNLKGLRTEKDAKTKTFNSLKIELNKINAAIATLDPNENLPLITAINLSSEKFNHFIEFQASIKTRKNVLLYPEFNGILKKIYVKEGQKVKKGMLLAHIDDAGLRSQLEQLEIQTALSKTKLERIRRLWDQKIGAEINMLEAKTTYESKLKSIAQLKKQIEKTEIRAPFSGTIDEITANTGTNLMPGQTPVMRIVNLDEMYTESNVPERYLKSIKIGTEAIIEIPMLGREYKSTIRQTGSFINPNNRSFRVEAPLVNSDNMTKPNLTSKLKILDYSNQEAILIPLRIIKENAKSESYVYRLKSDQKEGVYLTERVFLKLGKKTQDRVEVLEGLNVGDLIVDEGSSIVENNQRVKTIE